jgi:hypothetical protein
MGPLAPAAVTHDAGIPGTMEYDAQQQNGGPAAPTTEVTARCPECGEVLTGEVGARSAASDQERQGVLLLAHRARRHF